MAKLGSPQTSKYSIGTAELRIGPMTSALKLTQAHSVGVIDNANLSVNQNSVDLLGGFPRVILDTAIVSQESVITATLREYSRRNMQVLLGEPVPAAQPADVATTTSGAISAAATAIAVADETGFAQGDVIVLYEAGLSEEMTVARVESVAANLITLDSDTPVLFDLATGAVVFHAQSVPIGNISTTNYFAVQLIQTERKTGRPIGFHFWKAAIGAGMEFGTNAEDFASTELNLKLLQPAATEYVSGADLFHIADLVPSNPTGLYYGGGDA